jgi:hypothetical protein
MFAVLDMLLLFPHLILLLTFPTITLLWLSPNMKSQTTFLGYVVIPFIEKSLLPLVSNVLNKQRVV